MIFGSRAERRLPGKGERGERISPHEVRRYDQIYDFFEPGQLLEDRAGPVLQQSWDEASPKTFARV